MAFDASSIQLTHDRLFPVCHPAKAMSGKLCDLEALTKETLIHVIGYADGWPEWLGPEGSEGLNNAQKLSVDTTNMALSLLTPDFGVAMTRSSLVEGHMKAGTIAKPFGTEVLALENFYLTPSKETQVKSNRDLFVDWLVSATIDNFAG